VFKKNMARTQRTPQEMYPVIEAYLAGGQTQKDFCAEHRLPVPVFAYWLARYRRQSGGSEGPAFFEVTLPQAHQPVAEIDFPGGARLRLFTPVGPAYLAALLRSA
jgi:hypothetical protein